MREIRFRAWITDRKIMGDVTQINLSRPGNPSVTLVGKKYGEGNWKCGAVLMQFTGLKDKNGKEIYEGDILRWNEKLWPVFWSDMLVKYVMGTTKGCEIIGCGRSKFCEVVGNIYENPKLLKYAESYLREGEALMTDRVVEILHDLVINCKGKIVTQVTWDKNIRTEMSDKNVAQAKLELVRWVQSFKKDLTEIVKIHKNQGASKLDIINALSEPTGFNSALDTLSDEIDKDWRLYEKD